MADLPHDTRPTALYDRHVALGGRMVAFAGHALPVQYRGIVAEHEWTRKSASLFDVSHMGQLRVTGQNHAAVIALLERITPADLASLVPGQMRYTVLLNDSGGIEDDLIVTRPPQGAEEEGVIYVVVNASRKFSDIDFMQAASGDDLRIEPANHLSLLALQGPEAAAVLAQHTDLAHSLGFMQSGLATIAGIPALISRSGYTGEDGFEISVENTNAEALFDLLVADPRVEPAGLGARDSLRLEAGLCLYGQDMDDETDPVSAGLVFAIGKSRRTSADFLGADPIRERLQNGPETRRIGIRFDGRQPVREGSELRNADGETIGSVTSGTFSPTLGVPIAMGRVAADHAAIGQPVIAIVRDKPILGEIAQLPFVPHRYVRTRG